MSIGSLSTEILQRIFQYCDVPDVAALASTSKQIHDAITGYQVPIYAAAMYNSYGPVQDLVRLAMSGEQEATGRARLVSSERRRDALVRRIITVPDAPAMTMELMKKIARFGRVAQKWVALYPQERWLVGSDNRRLLTGVESERLRKAIYGFWTYGNLFHSRSAIHDELEDLSGGSHMRDDPRNLLVRTYTSIELVQLAEFVDVMYQVIHNDICPSNATIHSRYNEGFESLFYVGHYFPASHINIESLLDLPRSLAREAWGDDRQQAMFVRDMLKLNPEEILHLKLKTTTKKQRIDYLRDKKDYLLGNPADFRHALSSVAFERSEQDIKIGFDEHWGIIDVERDTSSEHEWLGRENSVFAKDASSSGAFVEHPYVDDDVPFNPWRYVYPGEFSDYDDDDSEENEDGGGDH